MWDHTVLPATRQVNAPRLTPAMQAGTRFTYLGGMEGWADLVDLIPPRPGVEPATFRSSSSCRGLQWLISYLTTRLLLPCLRVCWTSLVEWVLCCCWCVLGIWRINVRGWSLVVPLCTRGRTRQASGSWSGSAPTRTKTSKTNLLRFII